MGTFKYELGGKAKISRSGEVGEVIARGDYIDSPPAYQLDYVTVDGNAASGWFNERELEPVPAE